MQIEFKVNTPQNFSDEQLNSYLSLLIEQGQVRKPNIERIKSCPFIGIVYYDSKLIGIGAIKQVYKTPFAKANIPELAEKYDFELGYIFVIDDERYRGKGIAKRLSNALLERVNNENVFATTEQSDKNPMKFILQKLGFAQNGDTYIGGKTGKQIGLYLRADKN